MPAFLPGSLLALFTPRDPLPFLPPAAPLVTEKECSYSGISGFLSSFENPNETPAPIRSLTKAEEKEEKLKLQSEAHALKLEQDLAKWDPKSDENIAGDPFRTLFVSRINFETTESKLKKELSQFGEIKNITMVKHKTTGKPKGYAFVTFKHERDMLTAYRRADGMKIDDKRILVDVQRGLTVKDWRPRRLGGGLGETRKGGQDVNSKLSERERVNGAFPNSHRDSRDRDRDRRSRDQGRRSRSRDRGKRERFPESRDQGRRSGKRERSPERYDRRGRRESGGMDNDRRRGERSRSRDRDRDRGRRDDRSRDRKRQKRSRSRGRDRVIKEEGTSEGYGILPAPRFGKQENVADRDRVKKENGTSEGHGILPAPKFVKQEKLDDDYIE